MFYFWQSSMWRSIHERLVVQGSEKVFVASTGVFSRNRIPWTGRSFRSNHGASCTHPLISRTRPLLDLSDPWVAQRSAARPGQRSEEPHRQLRRGRPGWPRAGTGTGTGTHEREENFRSSPPHDDGDMKSLPPRWMSGSWARVQDEKFLSKFIETRARVSPAISMFTMFLVMTPRVSGSKRTESFVALH